MNEPDRPRRDVSIEEAQRMPMSEEELEEVIFQKLYNDTWTTEKPDDPDWHRRFPEWKARHAARLAVQAIREAP